MKRWPAGLAAMALAAGLAACGGQQAGPAPTPTATSAPTGKPTPTATPTSAPTPAPSGRSTSAPDGAFGPYEYPHITNTNGYNTYVANNMWAARELA